MLESLSSYYGDESPREDGTLIWGRYTDEEWEDMSCDERANAMWEYLEAEGIA